MLILEALNVEKLKMYKGHACVPQKKIYGRE